MNDLKICLCISGQPRSYNNGYEKLKQNILDLHNVDVYTHFWFDTEDVGKKFKNKSLTSEGSQVLRKETIEDILSLYKPIKYKVEKERYYDIPKIDRKSLTNPYATLSQYYSLKECIKLIDKEYDIMIKARFDSNLMSSLFFDSFKKNYLFFANDNMYETDVNDGLFWGDFNQMVKLDSLFDELFNIYDKNDIPWCNEKLLKIFLDNNNINYEKIDIKVNWFRND